MKIYAPPPDTGLDVIFADDHLLAVDKPSGLLSVPGRGPGMDDNLAARVCRRFPDALTVHRLDMDTSGIILFARGEAMHRELSRQFRERLVDKRYIALIDGRLSQAEGEVNLPLICDWPNRPRQMVDLAIGKPSRTLFRRLDIDDNTATTRVELEPITGRSHQLRVHMASLGHPILGDDLYGGEAEAKAARLMLHATDLALEHPHSGKALRFHANPPF